MRWSLVNNKVISVRNVSSLIWVALSRVRDLFVLNQGLTDPLKRLF